MLKNAVKHSDLVYDVGMHKGEDTEYYLKKGFRVVAFEANPELVEGCRQRFEKEIGEGRLVIVEGAIVQNPSESFVRFYKNTERSVWGTVVEDWAERNEMLGTSLQVIDVPTVDFAACMNEHGVPHYLKIDIEGMDTICLETLREFESRPDYVSIESNKVAFPALVAELDLLRALGYNGFKAVQQKNMTQRTEPNPAREGRYAGHRFQNGDTGPFGADLPGAWQSYDQVLAQYASIFRLYRWFGDQSLLRRSLPGKGVIFVLSKVLRRPLPGWYDTHAKHSSAP